MDGLLWLYVALAGIFTAGWRLCWFGLALPTWRAGRWMVGAVVAAWFVNRLEHEFENNNT